MENILHNQNKLNKVKLKYDTFLYFVVNQEGLVEKIP